MVDLIFTDAPGRVAKQLLQLAHRFGIQGVPHASTGPMRTPA
jgi:hypothetical protein